MRSISVPVSRMDEVVKIAFTRPPQPIVWEEEGDGRPKSCRPRTRTQAGVTAH